jgi:hypothetical protein
MYACRFEVPLLRLTLAHNQRNRARLALAGTSPERRLAAYFGDVATGHALTAELSNHGNRPVASLHVAPFQCFILARPVIEQWVQMGRLLRVLFDGRLCRCISPAHFLSSSSATYRSIASATVRRRASTNRFSAPFDRGEAVCVTLGSRDCCPRRPPCRLHGSIFDVPSQW